MALDDNEKALLERLQKKAEEKEDDDFEVEIWDEKGAGARVPYRKGKAFLSRFGIDVEPPATDDGKNKKDDNQPPAARYFGSKSAKQS